MTTNKLPTLLLFWVELYQRNLLNVDIKILKYEYTLEHIMPQKWAQNWYDVPVYDTDENEVEDADEMERVRSHAIYEIGNMTLLNSKLNTSISNGNFTDKINGKNGRKGIKDLADIRLTRKVIDNNTEWNELIEYWHGQLSHLQVNTPSESFNNFALAYSISGILKNCPAPLILILPRF